MMFMVYGGLSATGASLDCVYPVYSWSSGGSLNYMSWQSPNLSIFIGRLAHRTGHLLYETNNWTFQPTPPHLYVL